MFFQDLKTTISGDTPQKKEENSEADFLFSECGFFIVFFFSASDGFWSTTDLQQQRMAIKCLFNIFNHCNKQSRGGRELQVKEEPK